MTQRNRGFTLIELLVVITILAVLAGAAIPFVQSYVEESRIAKAKADLEEISRALAVYETREGEYGKVDVSDLTGRYLNKAPIDPWGQQYIVSTVAGVAYSQGPDRKDTLDQDKEDNIVVPYQPPLALVSVKWVDKNQSGAVDTQNGGDRVQLIFSRMLKTTTVNFQNATNFDAWLVYNSGGTSMSAIFNPASSQIISPANKMLVLDVGTGGILSPGADTISVNVNHLLTPPGVLDMATNAAIGGQAVKVLPQ